MVWLLVVAVMLEGNHKLNPKWLGPFEVTEALTNSYRLQLPLAICIHPMVNVKYLKAFKPPVGMDPLCKCLQPVVHDDEFDVEQICGHRKRGRQW